MHRRKGMILVVSGPSGAGKTSIARRLVAEVPRVTFSMSATTRAPRPGEVDGVDYLFCSPEGFASMIEAGEFLEWASYSGHLYGTPKAAVLSQLDQGNDVILDIETQGAANVRAEEPGAVLVFVLPPSFDDLRRRIDGRAPTAPDELATRMAQARIELASVRNYDYVVTNDRLEEAVAMVKAIVIAERCRLTRQGGFLVSWS